MIPTYRTLSIALLTASCFAAVAFAQKAAAPEVLLTVSGEVEHPLKLTRADLDKFTRQSAQAKDHDGKEYKYEGVALADILQGAGIKFGEALRGKVMATYVLVEAADGYQAVFALPEFDPPTADRMVLLANSRDGIALSTNAGPLQIIVRGDKTHSRWVRQVKSIRILRAPAKD